MEPATPANPLPSATAPDIRQTLGVGARSRRRRWRLWLGAALAVAALAALGAWWLGGENTAPQFRTEPSERHTLVVKVSATGTLQPVVQVDVGSEVSGTLRSLTADFNDHVKAGQVLARLDTAKQEAQVLQSKAAVAAAGAQVLNAQATVEQTRLQRRRLRSLAPTRSVSESDLQAAEADYKRAVAMEAVSRSDLAKAKANLNADEITLSKMVIRAPIDGIVLRRNVEVGQTVAASLQAPVLFTLADDLHKMQISAAVDEADVGKVKQGQEATFTVDAYPNRTFPATVTEVRFAPQTVAGVVTYEALLNVDNADLLLRPGMTATAEITVARLADALLVPNAALRFTPPRTSQAGRRSWLSSLLGRRRHAPEEPKLVEPKGPERIVWTRRNGRPVSIPVTVGLTDGRMTQVVAGDLKPGTPLLVDLVSPAKP